FGAARRGDLRCAAVVVLFSFSSGPGATRAAPCFSVFLVLHLVPAQRARMFGATRSRCWGLSCFVLVAAQRAGGATQRAGLVCEG
ncbi:hypothetical protein A2U01_0075069, partial [Trifolium medium]|nr:hypothetical protein [Trifolium medium]